MTHKLANVMIQTLPLSPPEATPVGACFSMATRGEAITYFSNLQPFDCHAAEDVNARHLRMARFHVVSGVGQGELANAFGVSRSTVTRAVKLFRDEGADGFFKQRRRRARTVVDAPMAKRAQAMLAQGLSGRAAARQLGVSPSTFNENLRAGVIVDGAKHDAREGCEPTHRAVRDTRDRHAPMGRAARDVEGRMLACAGLMTQVEPEFREPAHAVERGGVLAALPMLLSEGLLGAANRLLCLPKGYYGLSTIVLFVALMTLARVRNPESLRYQAPGEWGCVLGLDRCPEVKTLRRKIKLLAHAEQTVRDWQAALARAWHDADQDLYATLAVDGHVKVYAGRKGKLAKHFIARQKLCLPASASYWINALGGKPLLCVHKPLDPKMVKALEHDIVPQLEALGVLPEHAPDLTVPNSGAPALTLVFDREGWSPAVFRRLARRGLAVITWHKNFKGPPWPESDFREVDTPLFGPAHTHASRVVLAEKPVELSNALTVRQIRRRLDNGRQVALITTHPTMTMEQVAGAMFSRWSQENFFKYMRDEFNLDALPVHRLEPVDPEATVVNPARRSVEKLIRKARSRLAGVHHRIAQAHKNARHVALKRHQAAAADLDREIDALKEQRKDLPTHVRVAELPEAEKLDALPVAERLFLDIIRMIAYRAETRMMPALIAAQGKKPNARKLLRALLTSDADIVPEPGAGILRVRFLGLANHACERSLAPLIDELNHTRTIYPGTNLTMVYEMPGKSPQHEVT